MRNAKILNTVPMVLVCLFVCHTLYAARSAPVQQTVEPDYTRGEKLKLKPHVWSIGPTGASGTMWYQDNSTADARMIQIVEVAKGTPAQGVLRKGDVILGVGQSRFASDPRKAIATAITEAETEAKGGRLLLNIWRSGGSPQTVEMVLPVLGSYSKTSPWKCVKTDKLIDNACAHLVARGLFKKTAKGDDIRKGNVVGAIDALGLLATGEQQYLPLVKEYVDAIGEQVSSPEDLKEMKSWPLAYLNILLCEYYLMTKDASALPAIKTMASRIVEGRSGVGTWGHSMRMPQQNFAAGYGAMNQIGLTLTISLLLTQKCGVEVNDLDVAINQSLDFFRYFVEKGSIPYGDHAPGNGLAGNGKSAQTAILFDLAGEKAPATYFTRLTVASYNQLEDGHTGHFFNGLWGPLGAARGGAEAAQSYSENVRWFTETERRADGGFVYQPGHSRAEHDKYRAWSTTGSRLLQYCIPRQRLFITGKGGSSVTPIVGDALQRDADVGRIVEELKAQSGAYSVEQLLVLLRSWSAAVRYAAALELGQHNEDVVDKLISMLDTDDRYARYGACDGLYAAGRGSRKAVVALVRKVLAPGDPTLRYFAAKALRIPRIKQGEEERYRNALGEESRIAGPVLLKLVAAANSKDHSQDALYGMIAETLFYGGSAQGYTGYFPHGEGLDRVDRDTLVGAIKVLLSNRNGRARGAAAGAYSALTEDELLELWPHIYRATKIQAPSGVMFSAEVRNKGLELLAEHHFEEGIAIAMDLFRQEGWGHHKRLPAAFAALAQYGAHIKPYVSELKAHFEEQIAINKKKIAANPDSKFVPKLRRGIASAEAEEQALLSSLNQSPELKSLETYLREKRKSKKEEGQQ
jgi:hypothetical protein